MRTSHTFHDAHPLNSSSNFRLNLFSLDTLSRALIKSLATNSALPRSSFFVSLEFVVGPKDRLHVPDRSD